MQIQTVFKAGNSDVISIPKYLSEETGIKSGKKIVVSELNGGLFIKEIKKEEKKKGISKEFRKWLKDVLKEDEEILNELAVR